MIKCKIWRAVQVLFVMCLLEAYILWLANTISPSVFLVADYSIIIHLAIVAIGLFNFIIVSILIWLEDKATSCEKD